MQQRLLHVGCGGDSIPAWLGGCNETRLDIDPMCSPDIVGSMVNLGDIGEFDIVFSSHSLEHLYPYEVTIALEEFKRVLSPHGSVILFVPDLEGVEATEDIVLESPAGPIAGLDLIYGYRKMLKDRPYMAHKTGFVQDTLRAALEEAGFASVVVQRLENHALFGVAKK